MDEPWTKVWVVRGWSEELDPRHPVFLQRLHDAGVDVVDLYVPAETASSFDEWVDHFVDVFESSVPDPTVPLQCVGYCVGGNLLGQIADHLADRGFRFAYLGLIDTRMETTLQRLRHNVNSRAKVPRNVRLRLFLASTGTPTRESFVDILRAWAVAKARSVGGFLTKGPRFLRRRNDPAWHTIHLSYATQFETSNLPHHRYVARQSIETYADPTLNSSPWSRGGYALRIVGGDHYTCITDPHLDGLVRAIVDDLRDPMPLRLEIDRGQFRSSPRSDR